MLPDCRRGALGDGLCWGGLLCGGDHQSGLLFQPRLQNGNAVSGSAAACAAHDPRRLKCHFSYQKVGRFPISVSGWAKGFHAAKEQPCGPWKHGSM